MDSTGWAVRGSLLAEASRWTFVWASLGLVAVLLVGAAVIKMLDRWRKQTGSEGLSAGDQLSHFRRLFDEGTISREEFEQIRSQLAPALRKEMNLAQGTKAPPPPPPPDSADSLPLPDAPNGQPPPGA